ncbi:MAG: alpha/beta fold hydrolase [Planctomycetota bacterium]
MDKMKIVSVAPANQPPIPEDVLRVEYKSGVDGLADLAFVRLARNSRLWIVAIHGHGSHADQLYTREDVRRTRVPEFERLGLNVLTPNLRDNAWMSPSAVADMHDLLGFARTEWLAERFIFFGGSMGGASNMIYAALHPDDVAAVVALGAVVDLPDYVRWCRQRSEAILREVADAIRDSYGGEPGDQPEVYRAHSPIYHTDRLTMPIFLTHGACDTLMPVEQPRRLAEKMRHSPVFRYDEIPGGGHDAPIGNTEGLRWVVKRI